MTAKKAVLESAARLVGAPVRDAVPIVMRRKSALVFGIAGFFVGLGVAKALNVAEPWDFAIAGGGAGIAMQAGMAFRFLVRTEQQVLLTSSKRWIGRPKKLLSTLPPASITIQNAPFNRKITVGVDSYLLARRNESRVRAMLADLVEPVPPGYRQYRPD
ncbi:MAG: hypothetical protein K8R99_11450 [Actinomycetia bacterium]|nr:hypothetical protein [Actinomycetes bacterium]